MAPCMLALIMFKTGFGVRQPLRVACSICAQPRVRPSSAMPSAGVERADMKVSMQCAMASMPVAAVSRGGRPQVSSGSQMAALGSRFHE